MKAGLKLEMGELKRIVHKLHDGKSFVTFGKFYRVQKIKKPF